MFGVSAEWRRIKETTPDKISQPLFSIMMECILKELVARVLRKFRASRPLTQELANQAMDQEVCFSIQWRYEERRGSGCIRISANCATTWC